MIEEPTKKPDGTPTSTVKANPKDSMKSTWRDDPDRKEWGIWHWLLYSLAMYHDNPGQEVPVYQKTDPVHHLPDLSMHRWVLVHAAIPLLIHQAYASYFGKNLTPVAAFILYTVGFKANAIHHLHSLRWLGHAYGFFDGDKHPRDGVPDWSVGKTARSLLSTSTFRMIMSIALCYNTKETPANSISWLYLPLEIGLYGIILDFWFYWYHRVMHDNDSLWKYHRTHHLTKHPNPLLTLYADEVQELFDIAGIPLFAWGSLKLLGLPMGFYDWWICHEYVVFAELAGHSGVRIHAMPPNTLSWLLRAFDCELVIEDHDLHHRKGWKSSHNYGKQTRLWDRIFGTCHDRIECLDNVTYEEPLRITLWYTGLCMKIVMYFHCFVCSEFC
ncbi:fatty acid hydroxylase superfamily protein [Aulographum hederae CBS 113979]|uniref:Fatty acid hydroxylase superfamily protein n=1 Tax=Aulographum hederae CBS 113979 TaxID=1176131 RepID=A0A6G1GW09_9PEZI|nr:fatty acid hydroxylase superfamily protein [Aulographum hederae CBS 113979]